MSKMKYIHIVWANCAKGFRRTQKSWKHKESNDNILKILSSIAFIFITISLLIIAKIGSAQKYEISIYAAYPSYFWLLISSSIIIGHIILIHQAFSVKISRLWPIGIFILIFINILILLLPLFRNYYISNFSDEIYHLGMAKDIVFNGHLGFNNYYPISHILIVLIHYMTDSELMFITKIVPSIFYLLYITGLYLLVKTIKNDVRPAILVTSFASVLLFGFYNYIFFPMQFSLSFVPILLFLYVKKNSGHIKKVEHGVIFIILLILMPFLHPLGALFLVGIFLTHETSKLIVVSIKRLQGEYAAIMPKISLLPPVIIFTSFFVWFSSFVIYSRSVMQAYRWFALEAGTPSIGTLADNFYRSNFTYFDLMELIIYRHGHTIFFSILSIIALIIISRKILKKSDFRLDEIFFTLLFFGFSLFFTLTIISDFISTGSQIRIFCWALMASTIINGIIFHEQISKLKHNKIKTICVIFLTIILISSSIIGIFSVYLSPHTKDPNLQTTQMAWNGMEWFFKFKNMDDTFYIDQLPWRAPAYIYGHDTVKPKTVGNFRVVPPHFGYDNNSAKIKGGYFIISDRNRAVYTELWPTQGIITSTDFGKLSVDNNLTKIYHNNGLEVWRHLNDGDAS